MVKLQVKIKFRLIIDHNIDKVLGITNNSPCPSTSITEKNLNTIIV